MKVFETELEGVLVLEPRVFPDDRGHFLEVWHEARYGDVGVDASFVQDNASLSKPGVLRGLHVQNPHPQGKLVSVLHGEVFDVAVDLRAGSSTFGRWVGRNLSSENNRQLYVPEGFAHGFVVLGGNALVTYKCTEFYRPESELTLRWDDPELDIEWPVEEPILSEKDAAGLALREIPEARLRF